MEYTAVALSALIASLFTFYSGFGLGTILMPIVALFFPLPLAIALTAVVHLFHSGVKALFLWKAVDWKVVWRFGISACIAALLGAWLLQTLSTLEPIGRYHVLGITARVSWLHLTIGLLLIGIATGELFYSEKLRLKNLYLGGALSGFFGGLSGNQGAFRSAFLIQTRFGKESFIATSALIAVSVDLVRLTIYGLSFEYLLSSSNISLLIIAISSAFMGLCLGMVLLEKITIRFIQGLVGVLLYILGGLFILG
ncbi:MAG: sulfite exporter TauE/SafE family protein, partial [Verrucomicrobia bacterium]|nr:sulfite exporter TauE/SafE family protein [Verrucomicrobiota bacterium]